MGVPVLWEGRMGSQVEGQRDLCLDGGGGAEEWEEPRSRRPPEATAMDSRTTPPLGRPCPPLGLPRTLRLDIQGLAGQGQVLQPRVGPASSSSPNLSPCITPGPKDQGHPQ